MPRQASKHRDNVIREPHREEPGEHCGSCAHVVQHELGFIYLFPHRVSVYCSETSPGGGKHAFPPYAVIMLSVSRVLQGEEMQIR